MKIMLVLIASLIILSGCIGGPATETPTTQPAQQTTLPPQPTSTTVAPISTTLPIETPTTAAPTTTQAITETTTTTQAPATTMPAPTNVVLQSFSFKPQTVTISVGGTVVWTNQDSAPPTP